jgi:hypothetical protein
MPKGPDGGALLAFKSGRHFSFAVFLEDDGELVAVF